MDAKLKEFLDAARLKERQAFEQERDDHLISLGLLDEDETTYIYSDSYDSEQGFIFYNPELNKHYKIIPVPIKVSDEEYEEIKKLSAPTKLMEEEIDNGAELFLGIMNKISLVIGVIAAIALLIVGIGTSIGLGYYVLASIVTLLASLISWALLKVLLNISNNLHKISHKQK